MLPDLFDKITDVSFLSKDRILLVTELEDEMWKISLYDDDINHVEFLEITQGKLLGEKKFIEEQIKRYYDTREKK